MKISFYTKTSSLNTNQTDIIINKWIKNGEISCELEKLFEWMNVEYKLKKKDLDLIVANNVSLPNVGFSHDTNEVTIMSEDSKWTLPLSDKRIIADGILDAVLEIR